jgi:F0F1-type ATP synthase membrane subunit c/vacuolar-type H+-ATPase subunit K
VNARHTKPFAVIGAGAAITAAALGAAILQGPSGSDVAGTDMSTGVTVTATTPGSRASIPQAQPSITGPAPLPPEEQGLPG